MKPMFNAISQVSIIVDDLDTYIHNYKQYGYENWNTFIVDSKMIENMTCHGERVDYASRVGLCDDTNIQIELIQPLDEKSDYALFLKKNGPGLHHICVETEDYQKTCNFIEKHSEVEAILTGENPFLDYAYYDLSRDLGCTVELVDRKG